MYCFLLEGVFPDAFFLSHIYHLEFLIFTISSFLLVLVDLLKEGHFTNADLHHKSQKVYQLDSKLVIVKTFVALEVLAAQSPVFDATKESRELAIETEVLDHVVHQ
jgi:hypothetical protein